MKAPLVSVVVPIYNSERYLSGGGMVESLRKQTLSDIEILLVDDGSSDDSLRICQQLAVEDGRIRVIAQANGGEAAARNAGIRAARGKYLSIVDHDDHLEANAYEVLCALAERFESDITRSNFRTISPRGVSEVIACHPYDEVLDRGYIRSEIIPSMIGIEADTSRQLPGHWTYLYRRQMLIDERILYDERKRKETDHRFIVEALNVAKSITLARDCFYYFVSREGSNTSTFSPRFDNIMDNFARYEELFADEYDFCSQGKMAYNVSFVEDCVFYILRHERDVVNKRGEIVRILSDERVSEWYARRARSAWFTMIIGACVVRRRFGLAHALFEAAFVPWRLRNATKSLVLGLFSLRKGKPTRSWGWPSVLTRSFRED